MWFTLCPCLPDTDLCVQSGVMSDLRGCAVSVLCLCCVCAVSVLCLCCVMLDLRPQAGVVALMLQANPQLTWRDVQHIIVYS